MNRVGIGTRVINCVIDTILFSILGYILYKVNTFYAFYYHTPFYAYYYFFYLAWFIYYVLFESLFARTPGKWLSITKVVTAEGKRPGFFRVVWRSLVRLTIIDCFFFPFFDRTLHDVLSKTDVIEA